MASFSSVDAVKTEIDISTLNTTDLEPVSRNIEIKARLGADTEFERCLEIARNLTKTDGTKIEQYDVFYNVSQGRLKLRYEKDNHAQLIQYSRPDSAGPKLSQFDVMPITRSDPHTLNRMLANSLGVKGEVRKVRHLFLHDQTRIHLDQVQGLGNFLEFEVCLRHQQPVEEGEEIARQMRQVFDVKDADLLKGAYVDDLLPK